ncbi:MAG: hypothetical protein JXB49_14500 [Bacteroidales bacterium]|nr:hypothetical protein [Bacteroidales bacterium]
MVDKLQIYKTCLGDSCPTNDKLFERFNVLDDNEKQQIKQWKMDCLQMMAVLGEIKQPEKSNSRKSDAQQDDGIISLLNTKKDILVNMITWWESRNTGNTMLLPELPDGESKRQTLHLSIDLMDRLKLVAEELKISTSRLVNQLIYRFLEEK